MYSADEDTLALMMNPSKQMGSGHQYHPSIAVRLSEHLYDNFEDAFLSSVER
jgi:hypothetical protein